MYHQQGTCSEIHVKRTYHQQGVVVEPIPLLVIRRRSGSRSLHGDSRLSLSRAASNIQQGKHLMRVCVCVCVCVCAYLCVCVCVW